jgi:RNA polymerase sigma factor (sigma-70 family)
MVNETRKTSFDPTPYRSAIEQALRESIAKLPPAAKNEANEQFTALVERSVKALAIRFSLSKNQSLGNIDKYAVIVANDVLMAVVIAHHPNALLDYIANLQPRLKPELSKQLQLAQVTLTPAQRAEILLVVTQNFFQHVLSGAYIPEAAGCITILRRFIAIEIKATTSSLPIPNDYQAPSLQFSQEPSKLSPEIITGLEALVTQLPSPYRDAITMRFFGGMSTKEIAETLGKTENNTRQIIHRALKKLKESDTTGLLRRAFENLRKWNIFMLINK